MLTTTASTITTTPVPAPYCLRSSDGRDIAGFMPTEHGVEVSWVEIDDGDGESGPSCSEGQELMTYKAARNQWRNLINAGWKRYV